MSIKGWCPGAHRPMMSGDGLILRVRPRLGRLTPDQVLGLCALSQRLGNGIIDLTSRANLQLRGLSAADHQAALEALLALDLLDPTPEAEARRNITVTPRWQTGDLTHRLHDALCARLSEMPDLPAKVGLAIDTGTHPLLAQSSADFRFERTADGGLILRLDGASRGRLISEDCAADALLEAARWFSTTRGDSRRMARHVATTHPPADWVAALPAGAAPPLTPGHDPEATILGAPFGSMDARALAALINDSDATGLRTTPWRLFVLEQARPCDPYGFVTTTTDPLLRTHACPGAPHCAAATVNTRALAMDLAPVFHGLHVSGCAKGCAHPKPCATTLVGQNGAFDLVKNGHPWDQPSQRGLTSTDLMTLKA